MERNCEYNKEDVENGIATLKEYIDKITALVIKLYKIVTGEWMVDLLQEQFAQKD